MRGVLQFSMHGTRPSRSCTTASRAVLLLLVGGLLAASLTQAVAAIKTEPVPGVATPGGPAEAVSGRVIVRVTPGAVPTQLNAALQRQGGAVIAAIPSIRTYVVSLPDGMTVAQGMAKWRAESCVEVCDADRLCEYTATPNDPMYTQQYHHPLIGSPEAWDVIQGSASVVVAVVDSGVDTDHEDLATRIWQNPGETANGQDDDGNGFVDDVHGWDFGNGDNDPKPHPASAAVYGSTHGTHVAGIIGAVANNAKGVAGVDWSCRIMPVKVGTDDGNLTISMILEGFAYAVDMQADVINLSLHTGWTELWDEPIAQAFDQGTIVVVAAGNAYWEFTDSPSTWDSPVCNDGDLFTDNKVLGVAATDEDDLKADFSNYDGSSRNFVDVAAPGVDILSTVLYDPTVGLTEPYELMSGTSMACPVVAGVAAMVRASFPTASTAEIMKQIRLTTDNIDTLNPMYSGKLGTGRVNVGEAVIDQPPTAPKTVSAFDTPGDEGGSVTVSWSKSADDGKGFADVIGYDVLRSTTGLDGSFVMIRSKLAPGTVTYLDTAVTDLQEYWYQIRVWDAKSSSLSKIAGPAIPRDDLAPTPVENLYVDDTIGDNGGSVTVNWSGYKGPTDFERYNVYRSETEFAQLGATGVTEIKTITTGTEQVFVDKTTEDGVEYWYAVGVEDDYDNENPNVVVIGPVVSSPNYSFSYPAGLSMVAIGAQTHETDLAALLGVSPATLLAARYDPTAESYVRYQTDPNATLLRQALGRGFWLSTSAAVLRSIAGQATTENNYAIDFIAGWNMLGNPYTGQADVTNATVEIGGQTYTLAAAARRGYIRDYMWAYDAFLNSYTLVSPTITWASHTIDKGRGIFFRAFTTGKLNLPRAGVAGSAVSVEKEVVGADWAVRLTAEIGDTADVDNFVGLSDAPDSLNGLVSPPPQGIDLYFDTTPGVRPAAAFAASGAEAFTTSVKVLSEKAGEVVVRWPDLSAMPASYRPVLVDEETGKRVYMRTTGSYSYDTEAGDAREFTLEVNSGTAGALVVTSSAAPTNSGAQIAVTVSADAAITAEVLNIAGRPVRLLAATTAAAGEITTLNWDGRGDLAPVPAGRYIVRVTATTEDGQAASTLTAVNIRR